MTVVGGVVFIKIYAVGSVWFYIVETSVELYKAIIIRQNSRQATRHETA